MHTPELTAQHYDEMEAGVEMPDDPKPFTQDALIARRRAIREGRLTATPRDELTPREQPKDVAKALMDTATSLAERVVELNAKLSTARDEATAANQAASDLRAIVANKDVALAEGAKAHAALTDEVAKLTSENAALRKQLLDLTPKPV